MNTDHVIETEGLVKTYGRIEAVKGLTLAVPEGSIFAFLGPNGAGKSTTIKMLMNILEPGAGSARVLGTDSRRLGPSDFRRIGYVSEDQDMPGWMRVSGFVAHCRSLYPNWDPAFEERLWRQFDLPGSQRLRDVSRGVRMKAALLSSLAYRPRLLVLDEPFAGLDPLVRDEFIEGVLELTAAEGWTIFIASHDVDEVERLADWVGIIERGQLRLAEPVASLLARFRRIEVTRERDLDVPHPLPDGWLQPEAAGHVTRFVASAFDERREHELVALQFPDARHVEAQPMSLRSIFTTLARDYRSAEYRGGRD